VYQEWNYKAAGFVTYGGVSGGTRSLQMARLAVTSVKMMPMVEAVNLPFFTKMIDDEQVFQAGEVQSGAASTMLDELYRWAEALRPLRSA
jgi:NAD(P)H-dependent FMN reductase